MKIDSVLDWNANYNEGENRLPDWVEEIIDQLIDSNDEHETAIAALQHHRYQSNAGFTDEPDTPPLGSEPEAQFIMGSRIRVDKTLPECTIKTIPSPDTEEFVHLVTNDPPIETTYSESTTEPAKPDELKPCDECGHGGEKNVLLKTDNKAINHTKYVRCNWCGKQSGYYVTEKEAIAAWNTPPGEEKLRDDLADAEYCYETVSKALDMTIEERDGQVEEIERLKSERNKSVESYVKISDVAAELKADNEALYKTLEKYKAENERLKEDIPEQNRQIQEQWDEIKKLKAENKRLKTNIGTIDPTKCYVEISEYVALKDDLAKVQEKIKQYEEVIANITDMIEPGFCDCSSILSSLDSD